MKNMVSLQIKKMSESVREVAKENLDNSELEESICVKKEHDEQDPLKIEGISCIIKLERRFLSVIISNGVHILYLKLTFFRMFACLSFD